MFSNCLLIDIYFYKLSVPGEAGAGETIARKTKENYSASTEEYAPPVKASR